MNDLVPATLLSIQEELRLLGFYFGSLIDARTRPLTLAVFTLRVVPFCL